MKKILVIMVGIFLTWSMIACGVNDNRITQEDIAGNDAPEYSEKNSDSLSVDKNIKSNLMSKKDQEKILLHCLQDNLIPRYGVTQTLLPTQYQPTNNLYLEYEADYSDSNYKNYMISNASGITDVFIDDYNNDGYLDMLIIAVENWSTSIESMYGCKIMKYGILDSNNEDDEYVVPYNAEHYVNMENYEVDHVNVVGGEVTRWMFSFNWRTDIRVYKDNDSQGNGVLLVETEEADDARGYGEYQFENLMIDDQKVPSFPQNSIAFGSLERIYEEDMEKSVIRLSSMIAQDLSYTSYMSDDPTDNNPHLFVFPDEYEEAKEQFFKDMSARNLGIYANSNRIKLFEIENGNLKEGYIVHSYTSCYDHEDYLTDRARAYLDDLLGNLG